MSTPNPEYNYNAAFFTIRTLSNMHVGSGSENYGIVDKLIQRDTGTGFPCIYASSLKGAMREYFKHYLSFDEKEAIIQYIFGNDKTDGEDNEDQENVGQEEKKEHKKLFPGKYRFLQADLLSIPARSDSRPFYNATCSSLLQNLNLQLELQKKNTDKSEWLKSLSNHDFKENSIGVHFGSDEVELETEDFKLNGHSKPEYLTNAQEVLGNHIALLNDSAFTDLVSDFHLPIIARNNLADGRSTNLWYEQVLPRETRLIFSVLYPKEGENHFQTFKNALEANPIQIGANASVGYGFCQIEELQLTDKNQ